MCQTGSHGTKRDQDLPLWEPPPSTADMGRRLRLSLSAMIQRWLSLATTALVALPVSGAARAATVVEQAPTVAELPVILAAAHAPGARAVLINVWATWCDPCREEMPDVIRFYRDHRANGLRLILVSADDEQDREQVARVLTTAGMPADTPSFIKRGDDMKFINGLDRQWSGALPASFLFDGHGRKHRRWAGPVTYRALELAAAGLLATTVTPETKRGRRKP